VRKISAPIKRKVIEPARFPLSFLNLRFGGSQLLPKTKSGRRVWTLMNTRDLFDPVVLFSDDYVVNRMKLSLRMLESSYGTGY